MFSLAQKIANLLCSFWLTAARRSGIPEGEIVPQVRRVVRRFPYWARGQLLVGEAALSGGDLRTAYGAAKASVTLRPSCALSWVLLSRCHLAGHQFEVAVEHARTALNLDPSLHAAREELAAALIPLNRLDEARTYLLEIPQIAHNPNIFGMLAYLRALEEGGGLATTPNVPNDKSPLD